MIFVLIAAMLVLFVVGYIYIPKGKLTKIVSAIGTALGGIYTALQEQWHMLQQIIPPDYAPWLIGGFLGLILIAAVRPGKKA